MKNSVFIIFSFFFIVLIIVLFIFLTLWGTSPDNSTTAGRTCKTTKNCEYGLMCNRGVCLIPEWSSCSGAANKDYCVPSCECIQGVCVPIRPFV